MSTTLADRVLSEKIMTIYFLALKKHSCSKQQFFPPSTQDFFNELTNYEDLQFESEAPSAQAPQSAAAPVAKEIAVPVNFFDELFSGDLRSKDLVAPTNNFFQDSAHRNNHTGIQAIFGSEDSSKMLSMPPSYEEISQQMQNKQPYEPANYQTRSPSEMTAMDLENLFMVY